jgi:hypothetical protein
LCCLSHADLQAEYERYTILYLADKTTKHVRGMAEMTVIKLGEMVLPVVSRPWPRSISEMIGNEWRYPNGGNFTPDAWARLAIALQNMTRVSDLYSL